MPTLTEEDRRALDYQARQRRILTAQIAAKAQLAGDPGRAQDVRDAWAPVVLARREAMQMGDETPDCEDEV